MSSGTPDHWLRAARVQLRPGASSLATAWLEISVDVEVGVGVPLLHRQQRCVLQLGIAWCIAFRMELVWQGSGGAGGIGKQSALKPTIAKRSCCLQEAHRPEVSHLRGLDQSVFGRMPLKPSEVHEDLSVFLHRQ